MTANSWDKSSEELTTAQLTSGSVIPRKPMLKCQPTPEFPFLLEIWSNLCKLKEGQIQSSILVFKNYPLSEWNPINTLPWLFHHRWSLSVKITKDTKITLSKSTDPIKAVELASWLSPSLPCHKFTPTQLSSSTLRIRLQASFIENFAKTEVSFKHSSKVWVLW